jgi:hypothetical protein
MKNIVEELQKPLQDVVIIKLLDKKIGYNTMMNRLYVMWKPTGGIKIVDVGNDFFIGKFDIRQDREKVIGEGP